MAVVAYINFKGNCREAVGFYADVFGAQAPVITTYGSQGGEFPLPGGCERPGDARGAKHHGYDP